LGQELLKIRRPDIKKSGQWTTLLGEYICEEIYLLSNETIYKPTNINKFKPDWETSTAIIEVKTQTYYTSGTAGEKILGVPFKYIDVPQLYSKPLVIVCISGAEKLSRYQYGNLPGIMCNDSKKQILEFYKSKSIEYIGATDLLIEIITNK